MATTYGYNPGILVPQNSFQLIALKVTMALERPDHHLESDDDYLSRAKRILTEVPLIGQ